MAQIITEDEIFKYLVEHDDVKIRVTENIRGFLSELPVNIFKNEYYLLYNAIKFGYRYNLSLTDDHLEQIIYTNLENILKDEKVDMYKDGETNYTENERAELIQRSVLSTYQMLQDMDVEEENSYQQMRFNMRLYIDAWATEEYAKTIIAQNNILREGVKYGRKYYKGVEDAKIYHDKKFELIRTILDGDADRLSDVIDTSTDTIEEINRKMEDEESSSVVAKTGIEWFDRENPLYRGEMLVVQGGSGVGKTRQAINIAQEGLIHFKSNVLILSLEQKASRIMPMFISKHSAVYMDNQSEWLTDKDIIRKNLTPHQEVMKDIVLDDLVSKEEYGRVRVEGINLQANKVRDYLTKVWEDGFHFDIVVLDYIGILETEGDSRYNQLTEAVNNLKADCKSFKGQGFLAILPNQLNTKAEEALKKGETDTTAIGGSETSYIRRGADIVYTVHQTDEMKQTGKMEIIMNKGRLDSSGISKKRILAFHGQCLYLAEDIEDDDSDEYEVG